jgi:hypothetical protein
VQIAIALFFICMIPSHHTGLAQCSHIDMFLPGHLSMVSTLNFIQIKNFTLQSLAPVNANFVTKIVANIMLFSVKRLLSPACTNWLGQLKMTRLKID